MKKISLWIVMLGCAVALAAQNAQSVPDPWVGAWKLDPGQSKFHVAAPQEETVQIQAVNAGAIQYTISGTDANGKPLMESYDGKADGQAYPISVNGVEGGKMSYQKVSDREYTGQGTAQDGTAVTDNITLSPDGKTITIKSHGSGSKGDYDDTVVFIKQQ